MECCHNNGDPFDNHLSNLRWDTRKANAADSVRHGVVPRGSKCRLSKLTEEDVLEIRRLKAQNPGLLNKDIAKRFGCHSSTIGTIVRRECWTHV